MKIKANDDRIKIAAAAVLLGVRAALLRGEAPSGLVVASLARLREDYAGFKAEFPQRDLASARLPMSLPDSRSQATFGRLVAAVDTMLARIQRNRTTFSSLADLDHYLLLHLRAIA